MVDFSKQEDVERWLDAIEPETRRRDVAIVIAARAALRVAPLSNTAVPKSKRRRDIALSAIVLPVFRAAALPWAAAAKATHGNELRSADGAYAADAAAAAAYAAHAAAAHSAAAYAARSAADAAYVVYAASAAARSAAYAAAARYAVATEAAADASWIDGGRSAIDLARAPLWLNGAPTWATNAWRALRANLLASHPDWRVWTDWYEARLAGAPANEALEVDRALIDDKIWRQGPREVNAEIARLILLHAPKSAPEPELGSALSVTNGQLTLSNSESVGDFDRLVQSSLHQRLRALCPDLLEKTRKVGNTHPGLLSIVSEYAKLIEEPIEKLDIAAVWAVGAGLMAICDTLDRLPQSGVMAEPLEPEHLVLLKQVAAIHGGLILGFELGQKLTDRADRARLQPETLSNIMPAARVLLDRWSRATKFVEQRTREFFAAMSNAAVESSWRTARSGYAVYAFTRDALIAIGKTTLALDQVAASRFSFGLVIGVAAPQSSHDRFPAR